MTCQDLAAAVSPIACAEAPCGASALAAYGRVVESFHRDHTVIPMRFGHSYDGETEVLHLLKQNRIACQALIRELEGCAEMGLRVLLKLDPGGTSGVGRGCSPGQPATETSRAAREDSRSPEAHPGRGYLSSKRKLFAEQDRVMVEQRLIRDRACSAMGGLFNRCEEESLVYSGFSLLSLYFLVPRARIEPFRSRMLQVASELPHRLLLSGPWPPYNFVRSLPSIARTV